MRSLSRILTFIAILVSLLIAVRVAFDTLMVVCIKREVNQGPARLRMEYAGLRREGVPITPAELQAPLPPPGYNAAPDYEKLGATLAANPLSPAEQSLVTTIGYKGPSTPSQVRALQRLLTDRPDLFNLAFQAASKPDCVFVRDWSQGAELKVPEYATMREAARLIRARSYLMAAAGRYRDAVDTDAFAFRVAAHVGSDPALLAYFVDAACDNIALSGMEQILQMAGPNAAIADEAQRAVAADRPSINLRHAYFGEAVLSIGTIGTVPKDTALVKARNGRRFPARTHANPIVAFFLWTPADNSGLQDAILAEMLHHQRLVIEATALPEPEQPAAFRHIDAAFEKQTHRALAQYDPAIIMDALLIPDLEHVNQIQLFAHSRERVIMAGAAVLAYGARHGSYPDRRGQAAPNLPLDPFTQKPLVYRREPHGFVVYSAGPTGHFDGVKQGIMHSNGEAFFRYPAS